jgi:hypothetical protein
VNAVLKKMAERKGRDVLALPPMTSAFTFSKNSVGDSPELERILQIPRRDPALGCGDRFGTVEDMVEILTEALRTECGEQTLRPIQALALAELCDFGGLFAPIRVGGGKTLITLLAAALMEAERPLLVIPAKLRDKTVRAMRTLSDHWQFRPVKIVSYELLGRAQHADFLTCFKPDLVAADEVHKLKNKKCAVTRRMTRYMREYPDTTFAALSGTITVRSLHDFAHIIEWCLPKHCPVPTHYPTLAEWASAVDVAGGERRFYPGALIKLCDAEERATFRADPTGSARSAVRRRIRETPGVVATQDPGVACSLQISAVELDIAAECEDHFRKLRVDWETPDGHPFSMATDLWRHARELACGFYYRWNPRPPDEWLDARRDWCAFVREIVHHGRLYDSELQVAQACAQGKLRDGEYRTWREVRDTFKPNTETVWIHDRTLELAALWLECEGGLCWVEHVGFGTALEELTGIPYYGRQGKNRHGEPIDEARDPAIVSVASNAEGRNLQHYHSNLVVSAPPNGGLWEQLLGRTHREGQQSDEVTVDAYMACIEQWSGFQRARSDAQYIEQVTGQAQKLVFADCMVPSADEINSRNNYLWRKI